jgi:hypothetical protein
MEPMDYFVAAAEVDPETRETLEQARQQGVRQERERQLSIDRAGGAEAGEAANLISRHFEKR